MKKRTQLITLSVLLLFVVLVVLSSSIFSFSQVGVDYLSTTINLNVTKESLLKDSGFNTGKSIFFLKKLEAQNSIEQKNPYIKVVNIETVFPNKVIFHIAERQELFAIECDNNYYILDEEGKVLSQKTTILSSAGSAITIYGLTQNEDAFNVGSFIENNETLSNLTYCFKEWTTKLSALKVHIKSVTIQDNVLNIGMRCGLKIVVTDYNLNLSNKLNLAFSIYDKAENIEDKTILEIRNVNNNGIYELEGFLS